MSLGAIFIGRTDRSQFVNIDKTSDRVPFFSTLTNLVDIVAKSIMQTLLTLRIVSESTIKRSRYFSYIRNKSLFRCFVLLVPILGNIIIYVWDRDVKRRIRDAVVCYSEEVYRKLETSVEGYPPELGQAAPDNFSVPNAVRIPSPRQNEGRSSPPLNTATASRLAPVIVLNDNTPVEPVRMVPVGMPSPLVFVDHYFQNGQ